jgi:hypothetical protein
VVGLQLPELDPARRDPWSARLFYAYADNLAAAGRESEAVQWFVHAADVDDEGETDAAARLAELTGEPLPDDVEFAEDAEDADTDAVVEQAPVDEIPPSVEAEIESEIEAEIEPVSEATEPTAPESTVLTEGETSGIDEEGGPAADEVPSSAADPVVSDQAVTDADVMDDPIPVTDGPADRS